MKGSWLISVFSKELKRLVKAIPVKTKAHNSDSKIFMESWGRELIV
jgi:hypothetical protein